MAQTTSQSYLDNNLKVLTGKGGPGGADPVVRKRGRTSLGRVGMEVEARALAMEAAMAAGL